MKILLRCIILAAFFAVLLPSAQVFAADTDKDNAKVSYTADDEKLEPGTLVEFKITGGLNTEKENEATFDEYRTITGTASRNTVITIKVLTPAPLDDKTESKENSKENQEEDIEESSDNKGVESAKQEESEELLVDADLNEQEKSDKSEAPSDTDKEENKESEDSAEKEIIKIDGVEYQIEEYNITVSNLKIFSKDIKLNDGENRIIIKAVKNNVYQTYEFTVNRKDIEIKKELEKGTRVIPLTVNQ